MEWLILREMEFEFSVGVGFAKGGKSEKKGLEQSDASSFELQSKISLN